MIRVGIIGAAGLSGLELIYWLKKHPHVKIALVTSGKYEGKAVNEVFPYLHGVELKFQNHDADAKECDVVFLAVPNKASLDMVPHFIRQGIRVVDLSGVYRIKNIPLFESAYKLQHTSPELLEEAVFGLPEYYGENIRKAQLVANPGCYPTGILLGLLPFGDLLEKLDRPPIIDSKSGVSGAGGRVENSATNYVDVNENFKAYKIFSHQHHPEIQQYLEALTPYPTAVGDVIFTPHLLPLNRGILSTIYLHFNEPVDETEVRNRFKTLDKEHPFAHLLPEGELPHLQMAQHSNSCFIGVQPDASRQNWIVITAIDNLVKGAAGQAIQNMNLMFDIEETTCLI